MRLGGLGYLGINSKNPEEWAAYNEKVLGLTVVEPPNGDAELYLRMDERDWRIAVYRSEFNGPAYVGWEIPSEPDFRLAVTELEQAGLAVKVGDTEHARSRGVRGVARFTAPGGHETEIFYGQNFRKNFVSPVGHKFVTGSLGMGHVVLTMTGDEYPEALAFYQDVMGFRVSEYLSFGWLEGVLMHCGPRHHSLGLAGASKRPGFEHFMMEVTELDDVGRCLDRAQNEGVQINRSIGRHSDDLMVSFYMQTPSRFDIEFGVNGVQIDPDTWSAVTLTHPQEGDYWGHRLPTPDGASNSTGRNGS